MPLTERGTRLKIHSCFCTHGKTTGVGTLEIKYVRQLRYWSNMIGSKWSSSGDESPENDEDLRADKSSGYAMGTLKAYYSTVHTVKAARVSMRPIIRNNYSLRY